MIWSVTYFVFETVTTDALSVPPDGSNGEVHLTALEHGKLMQSSLIMPTPECHDWNCE